MWRDPRVPHEINLSGETQEVMNTRAMETPERRLDQEVERRNRRWKRMGASAVAIVAALALMGHAVLSRAAEPEPPPERVTVHRDGVHVYSVMSTSSMVVMELMQGDVVEIEPADTTSEGAWCTVKEVGLWRRSGYLPCKDLKRGQPLAAAPPRVTDPRKAEAPPVVGRPPQPPRLIEEPAPRPMAKATEPEVTRGKRYTLQVAGLVVERNALALKTRLEQLGFRPIIRETTAFITRHRVYAGEFTSREEAERTARRLNVDGFPSDLIEIEGGKFRLQVGSHFDLNEAIDLAHDLQKKNYTSRIVSKRVPTRVHAVRVGDYENRSDALRALGEFKRQGFTPLIVRK